MRRWEMRWDGDGVIEMAWRRCIVMVAVAIGDSEKARRLEGRGGGTAITDLLSWNECFWKTSTVDYLYVS